MHANFVSTAKNSTALSVLPAPKLLKMSWRISPTLLLMFAIYRIAENVLLSCHTSPFLQYMITCPFCGIWHAQTGCRKERSTIVLELQYCFMYNC